MIRLVPNTDPWVIAKVVFSLKVCLFIAYGQPNQTPEIAGSKLGLDLKLILSLGWHSDLVSKTVLHARIQTYRRLGCPLRERSNSGFNLLVKI
jgi:hypothetical protein